MKRNLEYKGPYGELNYGLQEINLKDTSIKLYWGNLKTEIANYGERYNKIKVLLDWKLWDYLWTYGLKYGLQGQIFKTVELTVKVDASIDNFKDKLQDIFIDSVLAEVYLKVKKQDSQLGLTEVLSKYNSLQVTWFKDIKVFVSEEKENTLSEADILKIKQDALKESNWPKTDWFVAFDWDVNNIKEISEEL